MADDELFSLLEKLRKKYPEMRFGQLICNMSNWAKGPSASSTWDMEDAELIAAAKEHLSKKAKE